MAIDKKLIHFKTWENFISLNGVNGDWTTPTSGSEETGDAIYGQIRGTSIVFIKDVGKIWTHGQLYNDDKEIPIDTAMSASSTNPVQNMVVKKYVDGLHSAIPTTEINALFN